MTTTPESALLPDDGVPLARLRALRVAASEVRADLENELNRAPEDDADELHDALASVKTVEALLDYLSGGGYTPDRGTLLAQVLQRAEQA